MDKKNIVIGVLLMLAAFGSLYIGQRFAPPPTVQPAAPLPPPETRTGETAPSPLAPPVGNMSNAVLAPVARDEKGANVAYLANDFVEFRLTNFGGAIRDAALRKYPAELKSAQPFVFNRLHADPMLAFVDVPGLDRHTAYEVVTQSSTEVVYRAVLENRVEVTRRYALPVPGDTKSDPYQIRQETTFRNLTDQTVPLPRLALSLGTGGPIGPEDHGLQLATGYSDGKDQHFIPRSDLQGGGFLSFLGFGSKSDLPFINKGGPIVWASVNNQFFTGILTPDHPATALVTRRVELPPFPDSNQPNFGITGTVEFDMKTLAPGAEAKFAAHFYVGPKEYRRLSNADVFTADQDKVMNFGFFRFFSQILLTMMSWVHSGIEGAPYAWGIAIIITTLILKIVFLPLTLAASKSAKRMAKIQPEMQALKEKFKDSPQKLQAATMELFKKHKVNPAGGCIPILITIPFFIGFFSMLQSTAELRFAPFLWANDLSAPDTITHIFGLPLNIMPLLMGATMIVQMRITPQPTVDNAQAKIFKFMPYLFTMICYNFSCALALYSTVNGLFTILQQVIINRMKDPVEVAVTATPAGKPVKNVTPGKKRNK